MSVSPQRDQVLLKVARESAEEGEGQVARLALEAIQDINVRDEAAATCALKIGENEGAEDALPVARMIRDVSRRNEVLQKLVEL
jgi:hypothetical protein